MLKFHLTDLPAVEWKTYEQYVARRDRYLSPSLKQCYAAAGVLSCLVCDGTGKVYRIEDRDVIEGYKLAQKHPCTVCDGKGHFSVEHSRAKYKHAKQQDVDVRRKTRLLREQEKAVRVKWNAFVKTLTNEEQKLLDCCLR